MILEDDTYETVMAALGDCKKREPNNARWLRAERRIKQGYLSDVAAQLDADASLLEKEMAGS